MLVIVLLVSFFLLLFIGVPISFALSISSFTAVMTTGAIPVINLVQKTFRAIDSFTLLAIPFFVFAGNVMARGGVSKRLKLLRFRHAEALVAGDFDEMAELLERHLG